MSTLIALAIIGAAVLALVLGVAILAAWMAQS